MIKIYVDTIEEKQELIAESRYLHDLRTIDTDKCNTLTHLYLADEIFVVGKSLLEGK